MWITNVDANETKNAKTWVRCPSTWYFSNFNDKVAMIHWILPFSFCGRGLSNLISICRERKMKKFLSSFLRCLSQLSFHLQSWCKLNPLPPRVLDHTNYFLTFTAFLITKENSPKEDVWYRPAGETQTPTSYLIWNVSTFKLPQCLPFHTFFPLTWFFSFNGKMEKSPERAKNNTLFS